MQNLIVRRRDGAIDIDHYRQEALCLRAQAHMQLFKRARQGWPLLAVMAIVIAGILLSPRSATPPADRHDDHYHAARSQIWAGGLRKPNDGHGQSSGSVVTSRATVQIN